MLTIEEINNKIQKLNNKKASLESVIAKNKRTQTKIDAILKELGYNDVEEAEEKLDSFIRQKEEEIEELEDQILTDLEAIEDKL